MNAILALALIFAALIGFISLRRKKERLQIFHQVSIKKTSWSSAIEEQLASTNRPFWENFYQSMTNTFQKSYYLVFSDYSINEKFKLLGLLILGGIAGLIINYFYLNLGFYIAFFGSIAATLFLIIFIKKRRLKKDFYDKFPEVLSLIIGVVSSGASVSIGFKECAEKIEGTVGLTMKEVSSRLDIGENADNVLMSSYRRLCFPEYYFFIVTIMVNLDKGGELKEVLVRLSKMLANNRILTKTRDSKTAELRMTVLILAAIPVFFVLLLRVIAPDNYNYLIETQVGNMILYYVVTSVTVGILFIKKMINKVI